MRYLLDTNVFLWALGSPNRLNRQAQRLLSEERGVLFLSAASSWEISIKYALRRFDVPEAPSQFVPTWLRAWGIHALDISHRHAFEVAELPPHHQDPFDRLLIAQGRVEEMTVLTTDRIFQKYPVKVLLCGA
jgi:PIN domain nuclease of toxin-antitoxin system